MTRLRASLLLFASALAPVERLPDHGLSARPHRIMQPDIAPPRPKAAAIEHARAFNAAIPLATAALTSSRPFILEAAPEDRAKAIDCLAAVDYYEAGPGALDQRAVAQVVLNRVRHAAFPATICGVVFAGAERATGCQFTFTCDGSLERHRPSPRHWLEARETAAEMLLGRVETTVGQATHYHTDWVSPPWDRAMDKLAVVKTHLFFRWRGTAGSPAAFLQRHAGREPRMAQLAGLSPAHGGPAPQAPPTLSEAPGIAPTFKPHAGLFLVVVPADAPGTFPRLAEERCAGLQECRFIGWTDPSRSGQAMPLSGTAVDAISFTFVRRPGLPDHALWNCTEFLRSIPEECLLRGT
jgi:spore germination cell wall hydrolase CwlJ-like protein